MSLTQIIKDFLFMAFRRILKKKKNNKKVDPPDASPKKQVLVPEKNGSLLGSNSEIRISKSGNIIQRLYRDKAHGMATVGLWFPLFAGAWLVSGVVLKNLLLLSLCTTPLILIHLSAHLKEIREVPFRKELEILLVVLAVAVPLFIFNRYGNLLLPISSGLANLFYLYIKHRPPTTTTQSITQSLLCFMFPGLLAEIGVLSQMHTIENPDINKAYIGYSILGIIPGSVLAARELLLQYPIFQKARWTLSVQTMNKKGEPVSRPGSFTRLVVITMILGPAFPALQLPFNLIPDSFLLASLAFIYLPKIAQKIQDSPDNHPSQAIHLANLGLALGITMFIAALLT